MPSEVIARARERNRREGTTRVEYKIGRRTSVAVVRLAGGEEAARVKTAAFHLINVTSDTRVPPALLF